MNSFHSRIYGRCGKTSGVNIETVYPRPPAFADLSVRGQEGKPFSVLPDGTVRFNPGLAQ